MPETYMKKPTEAAVIQFVDNASADAIQDWVAETTGYAVRFSFAAEDVTLIQIITFDGMISLYKNDWLVCENDQFVVYSDDKFQITYSKKDLI